MKTILEKHCLDGERKGLLLLSMPTGFGKTHSILDFIHSHYREFAERGSRIFFITNLKKNLPYDELKRRFAKAGEPDEFKRHVIRMSSTSERVIDRIVDMGERGEIPDSFKSDVFRQLLKGVGALKKLAKAKDFSDGLETFISSQEKSIRLELEPAFRGEIALALRKKFPKKEGRLEAIRDNADYSWIGELYPAVFTDEKTVFFMSMDKFFLKNTPIVEPSYYFSNRLANNSLIFIDEFDSSKECILNRIVEDGWNSKISLIELFLRIHNALAANEFPEILLRESNYRQRLSSEKERNWPTISDIVEKLKEKTEDIFQEFSLCYALKSGEEFVKNRNFMFHDYRYHHILEDKGSFIGIRPDEEGRLNWLSVRKNDKGSEHPHMDVRFLLGTLNGFLSYLQRAVGYMAENYRYLKAEGGAKDEFNLGSAIKTVLSHLQTGKEETDFLTSRIMERERVFKNFSREKGPFSGDFYDRGFRCYDIEDGDDHDTSSKVNLFDFSLTPEGFMADLCERNLVVGSSATAGIESPLANFDLSYLRSRLGESLYRLQGEDLERLKRGFEKSTEGYEKIKIDVKFIDTDDRDEERTIALMTDLFDDEEAARHWVFRFETNARESQKKEDNPIQYIVARYCRALSAWKEFYQSSCCGFLCLFSKLCKEGVQGFDLSLLREAAAMLSGISTDEISKMMVSLSGSGFEAQKDVILNDLSSGERRFVLSSYKTVGAGQNLQYRPPGGLPLVPIGKGHRRKETDWSGIYLDKPTSLLVNVNDDDLTHEKLFRYAFQLEFLLQSGAISQKVFRTKLESGFKSLSKTGKRASWDGVSLYETSAYSQYTGAVLLQAVGRICRTDLKSPEILILADKRLKDTIARFKLPEDLIPVKEFVALKKASGSVGSDDAELTEHENRASFMSGVAASRISSVLKRAGEKARWSDEERENWIKVREQVLAHPYFEKSRDCPREWSQLYATLPSPAKSYTYDQNNDYGEVQVSFTPQRGRQTVSPSAARLDEISEVPELKGHFSQNRWPLDYPKSEMLLLPPFFNNIYKGALGEACGRFIFEKALSIPLHDLEGGFFEVFDYRLTENVYVDFKLWNDRTALPAEEEIEKIRKKMERIGGARVFIVNILGNSKAQFKPVVSSDRAIFEIPFLCKGGRLDEEALSFIACSTAL